VWCSLDYYEDCDYCDVEEGEAVCCDDPYSKQYERETTTTCCQCAGDTVYNPITGNNYVLTEANCNAAVRWPDGRGCALLPGLLF
jgi:hypothetical protein